MSNAETASGALAYFVDMEPPLSDFHADVLEGLSKPQKQIPPKYFYDETGSQIFDEITTLKEYYPTRTEIGILKAQGADIAARVPERTCVFEYGSGASLKIRTLFAALHDPAEYVAVDISRDFLIESAEAFAADHAGVRVGAICADFTQSIAMPDVVGESADGMLGFFPGSTIGNLGPAGAAAFLKNARATLGPNAKLLIGVDTKKAPEILRAAYNDSKGVTAAFNLNLLTRMVAELGADIDVEAFEHNAVYNEAEGRIEMHLVSKTDQDFEIDGERFHIRENETIHTENSYKYSIEEFDEMARKAGFDREKTWVDDNTLFSIHLLR